jgi:hypothetical protein
MCDKIHARFRCIFPTQKYRGEDHLRRVSNRVHPQEEKRERIPKRRFNVIPWRRVHNESFHPPDEPKRYIVIDSCDVTSTWSRRQKTSRDRKSRCLFLSRSLPLHLHLGHPNFQKQTIPVLLNSSTCIVAMNVLRLADRR